MTVPTAALPFSSSVQFSGFGIKVPAAGPTVLSIKQKEFNHEIVNMQFWGGDVDSDSLQSGTPVMITFGRPLIKRAFYGYVNHAGRVNNALSTVNAMSGRNAVNITCIGPTWPMKQTDTKVWFNTTASQVIEDIAEIFNLDVSVVPHSTVWPCLQMAGQSYWQFACRLARMIGYTFYGSGIQLVFKPRNTNPNDLASLAAFYDYKNDPGGLPVFSPVVGITSPAGGQLVDRQMAGIDPRTNQIFYSEVSGVPTPTVLGVTSQTPFFTETEHFSADSQQESDALVMGCAADNQLYITASATAVGNPLITAGSLVYVQNANGGQNGLWFAKCAEHVLGTTTYITQLDLGRDSIGATVAVSTRIRTQTNPRAQLRNGTWVAA
jgi:hypothetical protein